jgi:hypothetical protein
MLTIEKILAIILDECRNGCTDRVSTYHHFQRLQRYNQGITVEDLALVAIVADIVNYHAIRENAEALSCHLKA